MNAITLKPAGVGLLQDGDRDVARAAGHALSTLGEGACVRVEASADGQAPQGFVLPAPAVRLLAEMLDLLGQGRSVVVLHHSAELTTQQAADVLHVSRPYLIKLLDEGVLPHRMVGTHRRIHLGDVLAYKVVQDARSEAALTELVEQAQELGMGY